MDVILGLGSFTSSIFFSSSISEAAEAEFYTFYSSLIIVGKVRFSPDSIFLRKLSRLELFIVFLGSLDGFTLGAGGSGSSTLIKRPPHIALCLANHQSCGPGGIFLAR